VYFGDNVVGECWSSSEGIETTYTFDIDAAGRVSHIDVEQSSFVTD
jgi:hypothetical protein